MFKVNNKDTRRHWRHSGIFIVNFEHISHWTFTAESIEHISRLGLYDLDLKKTWTARTWIDFIINWTWID